MRNAADRLACVALACVPGLAFGIVWFATAPGAARIFRADSAAAVAAVAAAAWCLRVSRARVVAWLLGLGVACVAHALSADAGAPMLGLLLAATSGAAASLATIFCRLGAERLLAGGLGALVLWLAMTGLHWADGLTADVRRSDRRPATVQVLTADPLMAVAYGASSHDRLHEPAVYDSVPLASGTLPLPDPKRTALIWGTVALLSAGLAGLIGWRQREPTS